MDAHARLVRTTAAIAASTSVPKSFPAHHAHMHAHTRASEPSHTRTCGGGGRTQGHALSRLSDVTVVLVPSAAAIAAPPAARKTLPAHHAHMHAHTYVPVSHHTLARAAAAGARRDTHS